MDPDYETLLVTRPGEHLLQVTLRRPAVANALGTRMAAELVDAFQQVAGRGPSELRCVVLTGAGERAFCAGADLKERRGMSDAQWAQQHALFERAFAALLESPVPVIAAVNGAAFGGGCELALCCDFIYAARTARFALTEVSLGIMPGGGATQTLARAVGERRAKELILTARPFGAGEALEWGLVNRVCEPGALLPEALEAAQHIARNAPLSVQHARRAIHLGLQMDLRSGLAFELEAYQRLVPTEDRREGIDAFNEKRPPRFQGR